MQFAATWVDIETAILSAESEKHKYMISPKGAILKRDEINLPTKHK